MPDFNKILTPYSSKESKELINTVVEIPQGSCLKIEWDRVNAAFTLDRVEPSIFPKPCNYGFIPGTLDEDGDELDTLIICPEPLPTGIYLRARIIGIMKFIDDGEVDDKIVCVPADNRNDGNSIKSLKDLPTKLIEQLEYHFNHYKDLKNPGSTKVVSWGNIEEAQSIVDKCVDLYNKNMCKE